MAKSKKKKFPFIWRGKKFIHRSARGSRLRYALDKICNDATVDELKMLLRKYDEKAQKTEDNQQAREFRTCCKIIRDWKKLKKATDNFYPDAYWDSQKGVLIGEETYTVALSEDESHLLIIDTHNNTVDKLKWE